MIEDREDAAFVSRLVRVSSRRFQGRLETWTCAPLGSRILKSIARKIAPSFFETFCIATYRESTMISPLRRVGSSMVEQRPFKALVEGSSPSQPTPLPALATRLKPRFAVFLCLRQITNQNARKRI